MVAGVDEGRRKKSWTWLFLHQTIHTHMHVREGERREKEGEKERGEKERGLPVRREGRERRRRRGVIGVWPA